MRQEREEAAPITRLLDGTGTTNAWVYQWNTGELSVLWLGRPEDASVINPPIALDVLAVAKPYTEECVFRMLERLSRQDG